MAVSRLVQALTAVAAGLSAVWIAPGRLLVPIVLAAVLAAANGYSKAYSP